MDFKQIAKDVLLLEAKELEIAASKITNEIAKSLDIKNEEAEKNSTPQQS